MTNGQVVQLIAILVSLEVTGILLGFLISYILYKGQIEFTEMMYKNEEKHNQKLFEEVKRLGDLTLEYEREHHPKNVQDDND